MKTDLMTNLSRTIHKAGFTIKKHSPEILMVAGVVGTVASVVMACRATLKVNEILDETKNTVNVIHDTVEEYAENPVDTETENGTITATYTQEDANKDLFIVYAQTGWKLVKLYGPAVVTGALSLGCMLASNNILRKRNVALAATAAALETSFKDYRNRVIDRFGESMDRELRYNIKAKEIKETVVNEEGHEEVVTKTIEVVDPNEAHSLYSVVFCEGSQGWTKNAELNKYFLIQTQNHANDRLRLNGILTLNEVYDMLGVKRTSYGQIAGWVYTEDGTAGDDFVDFGIFNLDNPKACEFVNGDEKSFVIDFNCIGNILDYM